MAGDVWRWCPLHQKWLQDANVRATRLGLESDRVDGASRGVPRSSRSFVPPNCQERMAKRPSGVAAASSRWQDDGQTLDPVPPTRGKALLPPEARRAAALPSSSLARSELGLGLAGNQGQVATDVENVWPKTRMRRPVRWLFEEAPVQSKLLLGSPKE